MALSDDVFPSTARYAPPFHTVYQCYKLRRWFELLYAYLESRAEEKSKAAVNMVVIGGGIQEWNSL